MLEDGIEVFDKEKGTTSTKKIGKILIPMIQRPYAQGRKSKESIRKKFLTDIFNTLVNPEVKRLELNFVYGTFVKGNDGEESNTFELLDGQQRLTTLFLLHWYLANRKKQEEPDFAMPEYLKKFSYQTRTSSTDFINKLVTRGATLNDKPGKAIRETVWYSKSFDKDTTIDSMLRMLDAIDDFYNEYKVKPKYEDLDKLQFYVLELNGFGLSEDLFIKMNARGLQLTPFENFKADLVGYMKKQKRYNTKVELSSSIMHRQVPYWMNYSSLMDTRWQDMFWTRPEKGTHENSGSKESDIRFFRFIQRYLSNKMITLDTKAKKLRSNPLFRFFTDNINVERHDGFKPYEEIIDYALSLPEQQDLVQRLYNVLTFLTDKEIGSMILDELKAPWEDEITWQPWGNVGVSKFDVGQRNMILISAMTEFIEKYPSVVDFDLNAYRQWMRVVHNLVVNTDISGEEAQINLTRLTKDWLEYQREGTSVRTWGKPYETIIAYNKSRRQPNRILAAEAKKAEQILQDANWEEAFIEAESNKFLTGAVTFYYQEGMTLENYKQRTSRVGILFDENGVKGDFRENYFLMRAVICRNYDWSTYRKGQYNFAITNDYTPASRYLKVLTIWNESEPVKELFCQLLDCKDEDGMKTVINDVVKENHKLILKDSTWSDPTAVANLQKGYEMLYKEGNGMQPLAWLYHSDRKAMGVYMRPNGVMIMYYGFVKNVLLTTNRNQLIPEFIDLTKDDFNFAFGDARQLESFNDYGVYSGSNVELYSEKGKLPNDLQLYLYFRHDAHLRIRIPDNKAFAAYVYEHLKEKDSGRTLQDGDITFGTWNGITFYQALELPDYESMTAESIAAVLQQIRKLAADYEKESAQGGLS